MTSTTHTSKCRTNALVCLIENVRDDMGEDAALAVIDGSGTAWGFSVAVTLDEWLASGIVTCQCPPVADVTPDYSGTVVMSDAFDEFDMGPALTDVFTLAVQRFYGYANDIVLLTHRATGVDYVAAACGVVGLMSDTIGGYDVFGTFADVLDDLDASKVNATRWDDSRVFTAARRMATR